MDCFAMDALNNLPLDELATAPPLTKKLKGSEEEG